MQSPLDKYIVEIDKRYQDEIVHGSLKLYLDTSYQPEWNATIRGKVVGCPRKISKDPFKSCIIPEVQEGDEILFSYLVVFDRDFINDPEYYRDISDGNPYIREYRDGNKNVIRVVKMPEKKLAAVLMDRDEELLAGISGSESEVERWLSGFRFASENDMVYCNLILEEKEHWMVDTAWVFGRKTQDGWAMVGGYVLMEPMEIVVENKAGLIVPDYLKKQVDQQRARVVSIGRPLKGQPEIDVKKGDIVYIDYSRCEKYEIDGKKYLITTQKRILGK